MKRPEILKQKSHQLFYILLLVCFCFSCKKGITELSDINVNETIEVYDFEGIEPLLYTDTNKTYIVNFWAIWCAPCVKELPYIEAYAKKHPEVEVLLVSMDFPKEIETKLKPFLKDNNILSKVVLLDDPDSNTWIDKIDPNWSGAIPFTIIFNNEERSFYERSFENLEDLENEVNKTIKK